MQTKNKTTRSCVSFSQKSLSGWALNTVLRSTCFINGTVISFADSAWSSAPLLMAVAWVRGERRVTSLFLYLRKSSRCPSGKPHRNVQNANLKHRTLILRLGSLARRPHNFVGSELEPSEYKTEALNLRKAHSYFWVLLVWWRHR